MWSPRKPRRQTPRALEEVAPLRTPGTGATPPAADPEQAGGTPPAEGDQPAVPAGVDDETPM